MSSVPVEALWGDDQQDGTEQQLLHPLHYSLHYYGREGNSAIVIRFSGPWIFWGWALLTESGYGGISEK